MVPVESWNSSLSDRGSFPRSDCPCGYLLSFMVQRSPKHLHHYAPWKTPAATVFHTSTFNYCTTSSGTETSQKNKSVLSFSFGPYVLLNRLASLLVVAGQSLILFRVKPAQFYWSVHPTNKLIHFKTDILVQQKKRCIHKNITTAICEKKSTCFQHDNGGAHTKKAWPQISWWVLNNLLPLSMLFLSHARLCPVKRPLPSLSMCEGRLRSVPRGIFSYTCRTSQSYRTAAPPESENQQPCDKSFVKSSHHLKMKVAVAVV